MRLLFLLSSTTGWDVSSQSRANLFQDLVFLPALLAPTAIWNLSLLEAALLFPFTQPGSPYNSTILVMTLSWPRLMLLVSSSALASLPIFSHGPLYSAHHVQPVLLLLTAFYIISKLKSLYIRSSYVFLLFYFFIQVGSFLTFLKLNVFLLGRIEIHGKGKALDCFFGYQSSELAESYKKQF